MKNTKNEIYDKKQIDSICLVENIPYINNKYWIETVLLEDENKNPIYQYAYIKQNNNTEKTYLCTFFNDSTYKFVIRELEKIKK